MTLQPETIKPNFTAWFVLQSLVAACQQPKHRDAIGPEALALYKIFAHEASRAALICRVVHKLPYRWQSFILEAVTMKGRVRHFALRKQEIASQARAILGAGQAVQMVILGAGMDISSLQLAREFPQVSFIEIDRAGSQQFKADVLQRHHVLLPPNVEYVSGDLNDPLRAVLSSSRLFRGDQMTVWLGEGFFMFLKEESVQRLLRDIREMSAAGSQLIFTTIPARYQGSGFARSLQRLFLRREKSDFCWAISAQHLPEYVDKLGYHTILQIPYTQLHREYIASTQSQPDPSTGEDIHRIALR